MPRESEKNKLLNGINELEFKVLTRRLENLQLRAREDEGGGSDDEDEDAELDELEFLDFFPPSPISPLPSDLESDSNSESASSISSVDEKELHYQRLLDAIRALRDEVEQARVIHPIAEPKMQASQLHLLDHFAEFRPHLFRQKVRVDPEIFDCILERISDHPIFKSKSNNPQLPVAVQLAIFLYRAGHYGNAASAEDVSQWAGVSVGSVVNCTNRTMIAILDQHDDFVSVPTAHSLDAELARRFVEAKSCEAWRGGIFAADGTSINLFQKPALYGETYYDRKSRYSLNCQLTVMPHNLLVVDYGLGHPGSVHDAYAFQGTEFAKDPNGLIPDGHWIWADSAYPTQTWCVVPFKAVRSEPLSRPQKTYNRYLSKIRICVEHANAALKGRFQSLRELRLQIKTPDDMMYALHWVQCCIILHNMIIRFEDTKGTRSSTTWAREEAGGAQDRDRDPEPVAVAVPDGTPGQHFHVNLMRELFAALGLGYTVNEEQPAGEQA